MALVDVPSTAESDPGTVEIILRATRLGLFTRAEAQRLIDRVRPRSTSPLLSIQDNCRAGVAGQTGILPISPDGSIR